MNSEDQFLQGLLELQYGEDVQDKLKYLSKNVAWANDWPENDVSFWNAEAFMWNNKIEREKRKLIEQELSLLNGNNLDLGCGSYSYLPSIGLDISKKMLKFNENCREKIIGNLDGPLPFNDNSFDSATAIFVFNYLTNYNLLLSEIKRVLKKEGVFVMVLSEKSVNEWQRQKEVNSFSKKEWLIILKNHFTVKSYEKEGLLFYQCRKPY